MMMRNPFGWNLTVLRKVICDKTLKRSVEPPQFLHFATGKMCFPVAIYDTNSTRPLN